MSPDSLDTSCDVFTVNPEPSFERSLVAFKRKNQHSCGRVVLIEQDSRSNTPARHKNLDTQP